jgi:hypothetical protein
VVQRGKFFDPFVEVVEKPLSVRLNFLVLTHIQTSTRRGWPFCLSS